MPYNREVWRIQIDLNSAWQRLRTAMIKMHSASVIRPGNAADVFRSVGDSSELKFDIGPMVFKVPERAKNEEANLYVVLEGWISFGAPLAIAQPRTTLRFGTQVGYFRAKDGELIHVYGVHYDMDETTPAHPVFHAQMCTQARLAPAIETYFSLPFDPGNDRSSGLLRNVRTPTAQMDAFSVITQIGADHLTSEASNQDVRDAFIDLRVACDFFLGAAGRLAYLNTLPATHCYRSTHWYARAKVDVA